MVFKEKSDTMYEKALKFEIQNFDSKSFTSFEKNKKCHFYVLGGVHFVQTSKEVNLSTMSFKYLGKGT